MFSQKILSHTYNFSRQNILSEAAVEVVRRLFTLTTLYNERNRFQLISTQRNLQECVLLGKATLRSHVYAFVDKSFTSTNGPTFAWRWGERSVVLSSLDERPFETFQTFERMFVLKESANTFSDSCKSSFQIGQWSTLFCSVLKVWKDREREKETKKRMKEREREKETKKRMKERERERNKRRRNVSKKQKELKNEKEVFGTI